MKTNLELVNDVIALLENRLKERISLEQVAKEVGYSKYHLHRMFKAVTGLTMYGYVQKRRVTESARELVYGTRSVTEIAYSYGYDSNSSFTSSFKKFYQKGPRELRKEKTFYPQQLVFVADGKKNLRGDRMVDIRFAEEKELLLAGYRTNTEKGFGGIPKIFQKIHKEKGKVENRVQKDWNFQLDDYSNMSMIKERPGFDLWAAIAVSSLKDLPKGMEGKVLPSGKYAVFSLEGNLKDSMEPVVNYVYREWFPQSTHQLNEKAMFDFTKYEETSSERGKIELWVPIL